MKDIRDLATVTIKKAFYIATTGRPGPVAGGHPQGCDRRRVASTRTPTSVSLRSYNPVVKGHSAARSARHSNLLMEAKRPMIYTGGGVVLG